MNSFGMAFHALLTISVCAIIGQVDAFSISPPSFRPSLLILRSTAKVEKSEEEWRQILSPEAYHVLREDGTEPPNSSTLNSVKEDGTFLCKGCKSPLFASATKFESGTGWPSFYSPIDGDAVELEVDFKLVLPRTEVRCKSCNGHLGHVFDDGPRPTGKRYCLNGIALGFSPSDKDPELSKTVMDRVEAAENNISKQVQVPAMAALSGIVMDGIFAALFIGSFIKNHEDGQFILTGIGDYLQLVPIFIGAYYLLSGLQKIVNIVRIGQSQ